MTFGKDIFCHGIEPYNFRDTNETVATITANVGQSTAIGPKVAIRKFSPFPSELPAKNDGVMGTIDAHIYLKNNNQDNSKYIIRKKNEMDQKTNYSLATLIEKFYTKENGVDILRITKSLIGAVKEGVITLDEMEKTLTDIKVLMATKDESGYVCIAEPIKDITRDAPHQQDQVNCQDEGEEMCSVRRLTPTETSTLQGFPKDYTKR